MKNNKSLGQHWLKDRAILDEIAALARGDSSASASVTAPAATFAPVSAPAATFAPVSAPASASAELCLEIGPGLGTLTSSLLRVFPRVVAVEFDQRLAQNLPQSFPGKNLTVINQDFLKFDLDGIQESYVIAGNIPYYITSPIIMKILETTSRPLRAVLLIQKEVAERIVAGPGQHTVLSLSVQNRARVSLGPFVPRDLFTPPPKVDSAVIVLEPLENPQVSDTVIDFIKKGFAAPRKKLVKNLSAISDVSANSKSELPSILTGLGISENARPADLSLAQWDALYQRLIA